MLSLENNNQFHSLEIEQASDGEEEESEDAIDNEDVDQGDKMDGVEKGSNGSSRTLLSPSPSPYPSTTPIAPPPTSSTSDGTPISL